MKNSKDSDISVPLPETGNEDEDFGEFILIVV